MSFIRSLLSNALIVILIVSCSKNTGQDPNNSNNSITNQPVDSCKLTGIVYTPVLNGGWGDISCVVSYEGNNLSQFTYTQGLADNKDLFSYNNQNQLILTRFYQNNDPQISESHSFREGWNPGGFFWQSVDSNFYSGFFQATGFTGYKYNGGQIHDFITGVGSDNPNVAFKDVRYTWEHGDPVSFTYTEPNSTQIQTATISYDTTRLNFFNQVFPKFIFQGVNIDGELFGVYYKYMLHHFLGKHIITNVSTTGDPFYIASGNFTYSYNAKGLVSEMQLNGTTILKFNFSCD